jgi:hypothetical protein
MFKEQEDLYINHDPRFTQNLIDFFKDIEPIDDDFSVELVLFLPNREIYTRVRLHKSDGTYHDWSFNPTSNSKSHNGKMSYLFHVVKKSDDTREVSVSVKFPDGNIKNTNSNGTVFPKVNIGNTRLTGMTAVPVYFDNNQLIFVKDVIFRDSSNNVIGKMLARANIRDVVANVSTSTTDKVKVVTLSDGEKGFILKPDNSVILSYLASSKNAMSDHTYPNLLFQSPFYIDTMVELEGGRSDISTGQIQTLFAVGHLKSYAEIIGFKCKNPGEYSIQIGKVESTSLSVLEETLYRLEIYSILYSKIEDIYDNKKMVIKVTDVLTNDIQLSVIDIDIEKDMSYLYLYLGDSSAISHSTVSSRTKPFSGKVKYMKMDLI